MGSQKEYVGCIVCGSPTLQSRGGGSSRKVCGRGCKYVLQLAKKMHREKGDEQRRRQANGCAQCGRPPAKTTVGRLLKYCSPECRMRAGRKKKAVPTDKLCEVCGAQYIAKHPSRKYCSAYCRHRATTLRNKAKKRENAHKRRCKTQGVEYRFVNPKRIFARDRLVCQICLSSCDPTSRFPDPLSPTLDHKIPLSRGGSHSEDNLQCAHWGCNAAKRDSLESELSCEPEDHANLQPN